MPRSNLFVLNSLIDGGAERWVAQTAGMFAADAVIARPSESALIRLLPPDCPQLDLAMGPKLSRRSIAEFATGAPRHYRYLSRFFLRTAGRYGVRRVHFQFKKEQILGTFAARRLGLDVVWTEHAPLPAAVVNSPLRFAYSRAANLAHDIVLPTRKARDSLVSIGVAPRLLRIVPNSLDENWFDAPSPSERRRIRGELGLHDHDFVVTKVCAVSRDRGHSLILDVAAVLHRDNPDVRILVVGDGPLLPELKSNVEARSLQQFVRVVGFRHDVKAVLDASDVFVNASHAQGEGFPYRVLEAMARGLPVVTREFPGADEVVRSGETGLVVEGNVEAFAQAIAYLKTNPEAAVGMGRAAQEDSRSRFNSKRTEPMLRQIFAPEAA